MKTMKIWRIMFMMLAAFSLASCSSDNNWEKRLTNEQKETYAQNISGEYHVEKQDGVWAVLHEHTSMAQGWDGKIDE